MSRAMFPNRPVTFPNGWKPTLYVPLHAQVLMGGQADLFDFGPSGTPACAHRFDPCAQLTLEGGTARICTLCGDNQPKGSGIVQSRASGPVIFEFPKENLMRVIRTTEKWGTEIDLAQALDEITGSEEFASESRESITSKLLRGDELSANWMHYRKAKS